MIQLFVQSLQNEIGWGCSSLIGDDCFHCGLTAYILSTSSCNIHLCKKMKFNVKEKFLTHCELVWSDTWKFKNVNGLFLMFLSDMFSPLWQWRSRHTTLETRVQMQLVENHMTSKIMLRVVWTSIILTWMQAAWLCIVQGFVTM